jgi:molybdopterin-containing oxidoreductase family iron-sulfur binding subunit
MSKRRSLPIVDSSREPAPPRYWRSREGLEGATAAAAGREFPAGASELNGVSRRSFMGLVGTSAAFATLGTACRKPPDKIVPYVRRPDEVTPGNALHFATAWALDGYAGGLLVESHEGRPTKIEGNPDHPENRGASGVFEQALILGLYDQDRAKQLRTGSRPVAWRTVLSELDGRARALAQDGGARLRFLVEPSASPLLADLRRRILERFPRAKIVTYSAVASDGAREGTRLAFGRPLLARPRLEKADVILSLDADFLGEGAEQLRLTRELAARRAPGLGTEMNRLYVVEPAVTITGGMADHRLRLRGGDVAPFAAALARELSGRVPELASLGSLAPSKQVEARWNRKWLVALAADLERHHGRSLVLAGRRQPAGVHALAAALNAALGNAGTTVEYVAPPIGDEGDGPAALRALVMEISAGAVDTLVITTANPAYTAPVDFDLGALLPRVNTVYHTLYEDETAAVATTVIPAAHVLESWGDARATDGTVSIVQPLIRPLWDGIGEAEVLACFIGEGDVGAHTLLRRYWQAQAGQGTAAFDGVFEKWLADGVVPDTAARVEEARAPNLGAVADAIRPLLGGGAEGLEIAFVADPKVHDGRFANNAWLQELPHPVTKLTWDNAVMMSQATAQGLDLQSGDLVEVESRGRKVTGPVQIVPGHADDAVTLPLGYGRKRGGHIAEGVGFDAGQLRVGDAFWFDRGVKLTKTGGRMKLAITQDHWEMSPDGRDIPPPAVEAPVSEILEKKFQDELDERRGPQPTIHTPVDYSHQPYKWGMAVDLSRCTGCSACVVACQSENNIPTVGKANVWRGREMQWLRIDRYFSGPYEEPESMVVQPLACVQCETAPCEYVCPVNATVHSDEGLNEMVYNRCIGTRYCSNNCPYKVRRFNFLDYTSETPAARKMGMNPDVTVRSRGVMEKCTYCVQRIERKRIETRIEGRTIKDGELLTACQQSCPSGAIVFGSLNDADAKVTRLHADPRRYDLLHEIGTRPRTAYLARAKNPNPDLAKVE